ncbi:hypothetical protein LTR42_006232 [Elasticomyces elasticus]|nr:hypothetical protein LTR42_006232 [Elasticomyces elasticus]
MIDSYLSYAGPLKWFINKYRGCPTTDVDTNELSRRFCAVIDRIKSIAPTAKIYRAEYPNVFGDATTPGQDVPLTAEQVSYYRERARVLNAGYAQAAAARLEVELIPVSKASEGHEVGTEETWMLGFGLLMPYYALGIQGPGVGSLAVNIAVGGLVQISRIVKEEDVVNDAEKRERVNEDAKRDADGAESSSGNGSSQRTANMEGAA